LDNGYISAVAEKEQQFRSTLSKHPAVKEIRSNGLFMAIELGSFDKVLKTIHLGAQTGFLTDWFLFCDTAFRIAPPLTITKEEVAIACDRITWVLDRV
jgi:acetylornithine/succinyldiaminopimelate/putrescine aminotransferase